MKIKKNIILKSLFNKPKYTNVNYAYSQTNRSSKKTNTF